MIKNWGFCIDIPSRAKTVKTVKILCVDWLVLFKGKEVAACDLGLAQPTTAHMALFMLYKQGKISHIVSQNCDGLHLRDQSCKQRKQNCSSSFRKIIIYFS